MTDETQRKSVVQIGGHEVPAKYAESMLEQSRGHMFRASSPEHALVFPFGDSGRRFLHMMFVPFSLDAVYVVDNVVEKVATMKPMVGFSSGQADTIIELPAGEYDVSKGDEVRT